jgi:hypothetical protein
MYIYQLKKTIFFTTVLLLASPLFASEPEPTRAPREVVANVPCCQQACDFCGAAACLCAINRLVQCIACEIAALSSELETIAESDRKSVV